MEKVRINTQSTPFLEARRLLGVAVHEAEHLSEAIAKEGKAQNLGKAELFPHLHGARSHLGTQRGDQLGGPFPTAQGRNGGTTLGTAVPLQVPCSQGVPAKRQLSEEKRFRCFQTLVSGDQAHHWTISCPRSRGGSPLVSGRDSSRHQIRVEGIRQDHRPARQMGMKSARDRKNQQPRRHDHTSLMVQLARPQVLVHYHSPNRSQAQAPTVGTRAITETADPLPSAGGHVRGHSLEDTGASPEGRIICPIGPLAIVYSTWAQDGSCSSATPLRQKDAKFSTWLRSGLGRPALPHLLQVPGPVVKKRTKNTKSRKEAGFAI